MNLRPPFRYHHGSRWTSLYRHVVGVTHNYFHDNPGGSEQGGQDYGLIAGNITANFSNAAGYPTWEAYVATSMPRWGKDSNHLCCTKWHVGCSPP